MEGPSELRQAHRTAALIAGGLITGVVIYGIVASVFRATHAPFEGVANLPEAHIRVARYTAWIASTVVVAALPTFRRALLKRRLGDTQATAIARLTFATVAVAGIAEVPAVGGFVLVIASGLFLDFYLLGSLSLVLLLANFPRYDSWEEWLATPAPRP